jgi:hypothetical protein
MAILDDLHVERAKYGATMNDDECVELCNAVAWKHRGDGWGLSGKKNGTRGRRYDGVELAHDILHHGPTNTLYDVLVGAGAQSLPVFNNAGPPIGDRPWVAPIEPKSGSGSGSGGGTPTNPTNPTNPVGDVAKVLEALENARKAIQQNDDEDHQTLANLLGTLNDRLNVQDAALKLLIERMEVAITLAERAASAAENAPVYKGSIFGKGFTLRPERT